MSEIFGKWSPEDVRSVMKSLDAKTGMNGSQKGIHLSKTIGDENRILGTYGHSFNFSRFYFDSKSFKDSAAIDVIRHEYCHYVVDALKLNEIYDDDDPHGEAWKTVCGILNTDSTGVYVGWHFGSISENAFFHYANSEDIPQVNIIEQIERWGKNLPSLHERTRFEKGIAKKYSRARLFKPEDKIVHEKFGTGIVIDTFPTVKKQYLYVAFDNGEIRKVQNCDSLKIVNDRIIKPKG